MFHCGLFSKEMCLTCPVLLEASLEGHCMCFYHLSQMETFLWRYMTSAIFHGYNSSWNSLCDARKVSLNFLRANTVTMRASFLTSCTKANCVTYFLVLFHVNQTSVSVNKESPNMPRLLSLVIFLFSRALVEASWVSLVCLFFSNTAFSTS